MRNLSKVKFTPEETDVEELRRQLKYWHKAMEQALLNGNAEQAGTAWDRRDRLIERIETLTAAAAASVNEDAGTVTLTVNRTGGNDGEVTVDFVTSDGTAVAGQDYVTQNGTLTFADGVTSAQITIQILDDVEIDVAVRIDGCEVSLEQLLALEEGDVIPLDARVGTPAKVCVDGRVIGYGITGSKNGNLAVRIERLTDAHIQ